MKSIALHQLNNITYLLVLWTFFRQKKISWSFKTPPKLICLVLDAMFELPRYSGAYAPRRNGKDNPLIDRPNPENCRDAERPAPEWYKFSCRARTKIGSSQSRKNPMANRNLNPRLGMFVQVKFLVWIQFSYLNACDKRCISDWLTERRKVYRRVRSKSRFRDTRGNFFKYLHTIVYSLVWC